MVDNSFNTRYNPYSKKYSKIVSEQKQGNTQSIIDNEIKLKGIKIDELNDWNKIKSNANTTIKDNLIINPNEEYSPIINNEDLFKNKQFRSNKDALNEKTNELLKDYSVNTSMFSYQQNIDNYDKIDLSLTCNSNNSNPNKSKTRRYRSNKAHPTTPFNIIDNDIKPINEEDSISNISPIEKLTNSNINKEYNEVEEQLFEAKQLIANLGNQLDNMNIEINSKDINDSLEETNPKEIKQKESKYEVNMVNDKRSNMYIKNSKIENKEVLPLKDDKKSKTEIISNNVIKEGVEIKQDKAKEKQKIKKVIDFKPNEIKQDIIRETNPVPLSIENYQYNTNVMQPYQNPMPIQMQVQVPVPVPMSVPMPMPYGILQQPIQPQIVNYSNQIYNQPIMQYQQQPFNPCMFYQYEPMNLPIEPDLFQNHPIEPVPQYKFEPDKPSIVIRPKPSSIIPRKSKEIKPQQNKPKSTKNVEGETVESTTNSSLRPIQSANKSGYNHIHLLKQIKSKNKSITPNNESKQMNIRPSSINKKTKEDQPHNKIYTTMKQPILKKSNNSQERITSAKTAIVQSSNNTTITNNNNRIIPNELEQMNELLQNNKLYSEKVAKIKENLNE